MVMRGSSGSSATRGLGRKVSGGDGEYYGTNPATGKPYASLKEANELNADKLYSGGGGLPAYPGSFAGMIEFAPASTDFMGLYEEIRKENAGIFDDISKASAKDAVDLSKTFTATNLANFETAMEAIQPGYKGLLSKSENLANDWLAGRIPEDVQNQVLLSASSRALQSGMGYGGAGRNLVARDFGMTSLQLQEAGFGAAQQLVNSARQTSRSLIANPEQIYASNLSTRAQTQMMTPAQFVGMNAEQDQFNSQLGFQASVAKANLEQQAALGAYQDAINRAALAEAQKAQQKKSSGPFGKIFGDDIGAILDPVASVAIPIVATAFGGPLAGAAAGAAWGGFSAETQGGDFATGAAMGGVTGAIASYSFGSQAGTWLNNQGIGSYYTSAANSAWSATATNSLGFPGNSAGIGADFGVNLPTSAPPAAPRPWWSRGTTPGT